MIFGRRILPALLIVVLGLAAVPSAFAPPKDKTPPGHAQGKGGANPQAKGHKHYAGKDLIGEKIHQNGKHQIHEHGKFSTYVNVTNGKVAGVTVNHADRGDVPVTKYKTTKKMARGPSNGILRASYVVQDQYIDTVWIGYAYIDDYGEEQIYWFPADMILDGETGAIEYVPLD
jgi:hypothetical protein